MPTVSVLEPYLDLNLLPQPKCVQILVSTRITVTGGHLILLMDSVLFTKTACLPLNAPHAHLEKENALMEITKGPVRSRKICFLAQYFCEEFKFVLQLIQNCLLPAGMIEMNLTLLRLLICLMLGGLVRVYLTFHMGSRRELGSLLMTCQCRVGDSHPLGSLPLIVFSITLEQMNGMR